MNVSKNVSYNIVVISATNGSKPYEELKKESMKFSNINLFFLTHKKHPNEIRRDKNREEIEIDKLVLEDEFTNMENELLKLNQ